MKILLVTYFYLPESNPRSERWSQIVDFWEKEGHSIFVITAAKQNTDTIQNKKIKRSKENKLGRIRREITNHDINMSNFSDGKKISIFDKLYVFFISKLKLTIKLSYNFFLKNTQWPDFAWTWINQAYKDTKKIIDSEGPFDILISVSHPFSSHIVAKRIKKTNPKLPWIIDMGDPFCFLEDSQPNNFYLYKSLNKRKEKEIFSLCDYASVTNQETKEIYSSLFPESKNKIKVIEPLLNDSFFKRNKEIENSITKKRESKKKFKLIYIGTLYSKIRNPLFLMKLLERLSVMLSEDIEMHFYGLTNDVDISKLVFKNFSYFFHGEVSKEDSYYKLFESDILVNISNITNFQLPSKLVDYAITGKPILNISSIKDDSSNKFLENYPNSISICSQDFISEDELKKISTFISESKNIKKDSIDEQKFLAKYKISEISKKYKSLWPS